MGMSVKKYRVKLTTEERQELKTLVSRGRAAAYKQTHGRILLLSDEAHVDGAMKDEDIARVLQIGRATVERVRRRCVEEGIEAALGRKRQLNRRPKRLDGQGEAHPVSSTGQALIALAGGEPPAGWAGWTLKLLAGRLVECEIVESISAETVRQTLKKRTQAPVLQRGRLWLKECWCRMLVQNAGASLRRAAPSSSALWKTCWKSISASMRTTKFWSAWTRPANSRACPRPRPGVKETRRPRPARPGAVGSYDYEYERNGVSNLFMLFAPLEGWRRVEVTDRRTKADWARVVKQLVDEDYPHKDRIVLVMDNPVSSMGQALNTHHPASLYEEFEPAEARRIAERLEVHYTPKPLATRLDRVDGSWLDMAEIEIGVMARQCLDRRIPDQNALRREVRAWQQQRNRDAIRVDWRFTTADARIKLKSLYPSIQH